MFITHCYLYYSKYVYSMGCLIFFSMCIQSFLDANVIFSIIFFREWKLYSWRLTPRGYGAANSTEHCWLQNSTTFTSLLMTAHRLFFALLSTAFPCSLTRTNIVSPILSAKIDYFFVVLLSSSCMNKWGRK